MEIGKVREMIESEEAEETIAVVDMGEVAGGVGLKRVVVAAELSW